MRREALLVGHEMFFLIFVLLLQRFVVDTGVGFHLRRVEFDVVERNLFRRHEFVGVRFVISIDVGIRHGHVGRIRFWQRHVLKITRLVAQTKIVVDIGRADERARQQLLVGLLQQQIAADVFVETVGGLARLRKELLIRGRVELAVGLECRNVQDFLTHEWRRHHGALFLRRIDQKLFVDHLIEQLTFAFRRVDQRHIDLVAELPRDARAVSIPALAEILLRDFVAVDVGHVIGRVQGTELLRAEESTEHDGDDAEQDLGEHAGRFFVN